MVFYVISALFLGLVGSVTIAFVKRKEEDSEKATNIGRGMLCAVVCGGIIWFSLTMLPDEYKGKPITELKDGKTYTTLHQKSINKDAAGSHVLLCLQTDVENEYQYYEIEWSKLLNEEGKKIAEVYPKFKVQTLQKAKIIKVEMFNEKAEYYTAYRLIPVK